MKTESIMIVGVGGQGSLLACRVLAECMAGRGFDVKVSEVHGMSQRGGSVVTYVRYGDRVFSPIVTEGECDWMISFEKLEAARYAPCMKRGGYVIMNTQEIEPMPVMMGAAAYPDEIPEKLTSAGLHVIAFDALSIAEQAGSAKAVNIVLMGRFASARGDRKDEWLSALDSTVPEKFREMNRKAFELGYKV